MTPRQSLLYFAFAVPLWLRMSSTNVDAQILSVAFVTTPNDTTAKEIARGLIKNKLAACVSIIPQITSVYEWDGEMNEDSEVMLMIKTRTSRMTAVTEYVSHKHPHQVCEVISMKIDDGNPPYLHWVTKVVPE